MYEKLFLLFVYILSRLKILTCLSHLIWGKPMDYHHLLHKYLHSLHLCGENEIQVMKQCLSKLITTQIRLSYPAQLKLSCKLKSWLSISLPALFLAFLSCCWHFSLPTSGRCTCFIDCWYFWSTNFDLPHPVAMQLCPNWPTF